MNIEYNNSKIEQISVNDIIPNRFQPRKNFDPQLLEELAESIRQYGIVQPLVLRKLGNKYEIIAGERRYKAACMIGLTQVPSIVMELDDTSSAEIALIENVQRKDLTAIEEAKSYKQILGLGQIKQEELAKKIGKTQSTISNKLRLLNLSDEAQQALLDSKISERHARSLLRLKDKNIQNETLNRIIEKRMTVRETDKYIKDLIDNHNAEEQTEEILDFSDENDKKGDNMNQNINNNNNTPIIDNFTQGTGIPNIPDYDQININNEQQNGAYINEQVVNNAQISEPSRFFNYDNQAANMNFDPSFAPNQGNFITNNTQSNYNQAGQTSFNQPQFEQPQINNEVNNLSDANGNSLNDTFNNFNTNNMNEIDNNNNNEQQSQIDNNNISNFNPPNVQNNMNSNFNQQNNLDNQFNNLNQPNNFDNQVNNFNQVNNVEANNTPNDFNYNSTNFEQPQQPIFNNEQNLNNNDNHMLNNFTSSQQDINQQPNMFAQTQQQPFMPSPEVENNMQNNLEQPTDNNINQNYNTSNFQTNNNDFNDNQQNINTIEQQSNFNDQNNQQYMQNDTFNNFNNNYNNQGINDPINTDNNQYDNNMASHTMIIQQDITGAVAVMRNTVMNLQNNGYAIEINEQDLGNLYQIVINFRK